MLRTLLALALALGLGAAPAGAEDPADTLQADAGPQLEARALEVVERMAQRISAAPSLSLRGEISWDVVQADGRTLEFGATREVLLRRPDRLRVEMNLRDGGQRRLLYDGARVVFHDLEHAVYAAAPRLGPVDAMIEWVGDRFGVPVALAEFLSPDLPALLRDGLQAADHVADENLDGTRCDHVSLRNETGGIQIWIGQEDSLPRRITISYEREEGQPQFRARFEDWNLAPSAPDSSFAFVPPEAAEKVAFARRPGAAPAEEAR